MRFKLYKVVVVAFVLAAILAPRAIAAPFVNLNFEDATVPPGTPHGAVSASLAFPGWTPRIGGSVVSSVYYDYEGIGEPGIVLYDTPLGIGGFPVLEGAYSTCLISEVGSQLMVSLSQFGELPISAQSIRFLAPQDRRPVDVLINGNLLPITRLSPPSGGGNDPVLYGADIRTFAGANVELLLRSLTLASGLLGGVDAVLFSNTPIPEPMMTSIPVLLLTLFTIHESRRRRRRTATRD